VATVAAAVSRDEAVASLQTTVTTLLRIKSTMGTLAMPEMDGMIKAAGDPDKEVVSLGDSSSVPKVPETAARKAQSTLLQLDAVIQQFATQGGGRDLGEAPQAKELVVDSKELSKVLVIDSDDRRKAVQRVLDYLNSEAADGAHMTEAEIDKVREFYIDATANALASFGYEDSDFGEHDMSDRRGDALSAREHMEKEDNAMHLEAVDHSHESSADREESAARILARLQETLRLSQYLDRVVNDRQEDELAATEAKTNDDLAKLQDDEDAIEKGISDLLDTVRAAEAKANSIPEEKAEKKPAATKIPLPRLEGKLRGYVAKDLDGVQRSLDVMGKQGETIPSKTEMELDRYITAITEHMLKSYLSYQAWSDKGAMSRESKAIAAGDPEAPSRITGQSMSAQRLVEHFLLSTMSRPQHRPVPTILPDFGMNREIALPGGGHVMIVAAQP
jgi:hypothetical protein